MIDLAEFGKQMGALIREAVAPLESRIKELEAALEASEKLDVSEVVAEVLATEQFKTLIDLQAAESVGSYMAENPVQHGKDGTDGKEGTGLAGAIIDRDGELVVTKTDGGVIRLGKVIGHDGAKGADGKDGADFTNVEMDYDGERTLTIRGAGGEIVKRLPIPMDRGYYRAGMACEKGDIVTEAGNAWIALKDTTAKPGHDAKDDWRMFARKGRDGDPGPAGKDYKPPEPVKLVNNG
jgi:hypothetical protein